MRHLLLLGTMLGLSAPALAAGDLLVAPTRVVLEGARSTEVILNNIGPTPATYRISLELRRMDAVGRLTDVDPAQATPAEQAILAMVSFAPRRVLLAPNQPQAVRIGIRPAPDLPDGEYRGHLLFRAVPEVAPAKAATEAKGVSIALTPIYGITIPIIVRQGRLSTAATLEQPRRCAQANDGSIVAPSGSAPRAFCFDIARTGQRSTYGRVRVTKAGEGKPLIEARGVAVYAELARRTVALPVDAATYAKLSGPISIEYLDDGEDASGGTIAKLQARLP